MNKDLAYLLSTGDVISKRSLALHNDVQDVCYTTEYLMNSALGPFKFWITWINPENIDFEICKVIPMVKYAARARLYFPAYLDTRIPPENREGLQQILDYFGLKEYDKYDLIIASKGKNTHKYGQVRPIEPTDCDFGFIHAIDEIVTEYKRTLN